MRLVSNKILAVAAALLLPAAAEALLDPCSFNFGMHWDKGPSFPEEVGYVTIWTNSGFDGSYHGAMLNALKSTNKTPVFYGYLIAKTSGLGDCDVSGGNNLCTEGANYIRRNMSKIENAYSSFAQSAAQIWGTERQIVFMAEPDFYQYFQSNNQRGNPIPEDSAGIIMGKIHAAVRKYLPQAEFSFDISPWVSQKPWFQQFDTASFSWANTSGGRTLGGSTYIREENTLTWAKAATALRKGIIADVGYGVGGGPDQTGAAAWNDAANLNKRIADGVVAITNSLADYSWGNTLKTLRPQLNGSLKSCLENGPKVSKFALTTEVVGSGSVARDLAGPSYDSGKTVRLAALPAVGYRFVSWSGAATGTNPAISVTMDKARSVTATFEVGPNGTPKGVGAELVKGGDFSSASDWNLAVNCGAASGSVSNGAYVVNITDAGSAGYCIQLQQGGLNLESGKSYMFSFAAKASAARSMIGYVGQSASPYTNYLLGANGDWSVSLTSSVQPFSKTFTMSSSDASARIDLNLGGAGTGTVTIDDVKLSSGRALPQYELTTSVAGKTTNKILRVPDQALYDSGTSVALFAVPDSNTKFSQWALDASGTNSTAIVVLDGARKVAANFGGVAVRGRALRPGSIRLEGARIVVAPGGDIVVATLRTAQGRAVRELHRGTREAGLSLELPRGLARGIYMVELVTAEGRVSIAVPVAR